MEEGSVDSFARVLKNLEADITCGICYEHYCDPKLLPCAHYFCRQCVKRVAQHAKGKPFPCPMCSEITSLPQRGVDELPSAFFVTTMLEMYRAVDGKKDELRGPRKLTCDVCRKENVTNFCKECDQFFCLVCSETQHTLAAYAKHNLMSLEELRKKGERGLQSRVSLVSSDSTASYTDPRMPGMESLDGKTKYSVCPKHDDPIKVYCYDHDLLICRDCTLYDHPESKCRTGFIREEAPKTRRALTNALVPLQKARESVMAAERDVEAIQDQVESQEISLVQTVKKSFEQICSRVNHCEQALLQGIGRMGRAKKDALLGQQKALQIATKEADSTIETVNQDIDNLTDEELMGSHRQLEIQMQKELAKHKQRNLKPVTAADMVCNPPSPDIVPTRLGLVYPREDLHHLCIEPPPLAFVGLEADYKVRLPYSVGERIEVEAQSLVDPGCVIRARVKPYEDKEVILCGVIVARYDITFTPRVRGPHKLTTKINGQEIPGSPVIFFVQIHPSHLGYIVRESDEAGKPYGIALTPEGTLVVAGNGSKELKFWTRDLQPIGKPIRCDKFRYPRGVAASHGGVIYSTDKGIEKTKDYTIMKFVNGNLQRGTVYGSRNVRLIKIIRGQLYVADERNSQVHVFSGDLDHIRTFNTPKATDTHDIAEYNNHLYVVGNTQIAIYTFDGRFIGNVAIKGATLSLMRAICFDRGGNMFITQAGSGVEGVYVFKPTGEFITSFGHHMDYPCGLVIDDDGFVYVCDHKPKNRKIYVY